MQYNRFLSQKIVKHRNGLVVFYSFMNVLSESIYGCKERVCNVSNSLLTHEYFTCLTGSNLFDITLN